jgi:hypothetical protein
MRHRCLYKPRAMQNALIFSHIVAVGIYLGSTVLLGVAIETIGRRATDACARRRAYAELFKSYNPLAIAVLGVVVMTGAWSLTPYKAALGAGYFAQVGSILAGKLALAFAVILFATWICFGICHRVVRADQGALPVTDAELRNILKRLRMAIWLTVAMTLITIWFARGMHPPVPVGFGG